MRVDRFLYQSRLTRSRAAAAALVEAGGVRIDRRRAVRGSDRLRVGSILVFASAGRVRVVEVLALPERRGPAAANATLWREISCDRQRSEPVDEGGTAT